jgi:hypothetical protein
VEKTLCATGFRPAVSLAFRPPADAGSEEGTTGLPEGFKNRLLAHESIGGFLAHAGWNSIRRQSMGGARSSGP